MAEPTDFSFRTPWSWHALPVERSNAWGSRSFEITQRSGRKIWLMQLHQYGPEAGRLAGIPQVRDSLIDSAYKAAVSYCGERENPPVFLIPRLIQHPIHTHPDMQDSLDERFPRAMLPNVTCIGEFCSDSPKKDALGSMVVIIWYQNCFGLPTDEHILAQIRELDWENHAWDWEF